MLTNDAGESAVSEGSPLIPADADESSDVADGIFLFRFHFIRRF